MKRIWMIALGDFMAFWMSLYLILSIRIGDVWGSPLAASHVAPFSILYISWTLTFFLFGLYDLFIIKPTIPHLRRFGLALSISLFVGVILFYLFPIFNIAPKTNLVLQVFLFGILSFSTRRIFYLLYSKQITRPVIIVGEKEHLEELYYAIKNNPQIGLKVTSYSDDLSSSLKNCSQQKNGVVIIDTDLNKINSQDLINLHKNKNDIIDIAEAYERYLYKIPVGVISQSWILENIKVKKDVFYSLLLRIIEIIFSLIVLFLFSPLIVIFAILIYAENKGPVFYVQNRVGLNGKIFKLYKLRSMFLDAEKGGVQWSTGKDDPRITKIGKIIRTTHIDEIPQMINIIKGDLSIVGPRPERPEFVVRLEDVIPHYKLRHIIRPGFTGWAQIKYRYARTEEDSRKKFEYDLYYIKNRNIFIDFGIIIRTIQIIFTH